jgi:EAL domain-containing protein (putative c-di-GMP-specific phosphodiesterase class I)/AmiR/NasT family two-component response regulator
MDFSELHVMVVEDHDFQRRVAVQLLRRLGVTELREAANGLEALRTLGEMPGKPDVVISDLDMPGMDGIEFIRNVAKLHLAHAVAVTSSLDAAMLNTVETMARAYGLQVLGTIEKPLTERRLTQILGLYQRHADEARVTHPEREELTAEALRAALDRGEFVAHYQPKIDLRTGRPKGVEALARWEQPDGRMRLPAFFLPSIEKTGLLDTLTERLLLDACVAAKRWESRSLVLNVSVNVSMVSLSDVDVADRYLAIVRGNGVDPRQITIEVTENAVMREAAKALDALARLRLKGFGLSIDDFGTGYSSLQQLGAIPFTELKVDQSFVHGACEDPRKRTMVETSLELARKLKLLSVAEGAETREEWDLLVALGCDQVQGWFVSKALKAGEVADWARRWKPPSITH